MVGEGLGSAPGRRAASRRLPPAITGTRQAADGTPVGVGTGEGVRGARNLPAAASSPLCVQQGGCGGALL